MADYYPILARAVSSLPNNNAQARRELYDRARAIVVEQLRRRDPGEVTGDTSRERMALEAAIRRVEAESRAAQSRPEPAVAQPPAPQRPAPRAAKPPATPTVRVAAAAQPKPAANYLAKILQALQSSAAGEKVPPKSDRAKTKKDDAATARPEAPIDQPDNPRPQETGELGGMLHSLATMLLALTYCVAALAFTGVVYFRGSVMVAAGIIGYPVLLLMTAAVVCLFVIPPWAFFRKTLALPTIGFLFAIHSASRQAS